VLLCFNRRTAAYRPDAARWASTTPPKGDNRSAALVSTLAPQIPDVISSALAAARIGWTIPEIALYVRNAILGELDKLPTEKHTVAVHLLGSPTISRGRAFCSQ
jgi:hypothetical protein